MMKKNPIILSVLVLMLLSLACNMTSEVSDEPPNQESVPLDADDSVATAVAETLAAAPTQAPTVILPTDAPLTPEQANAGEHRYWTEAFENGCEASDIEDYPQHRVKVHTFSSDLNQVTYGERVYDRVAEHRYQSINESDKPLVLVYTLEGVSLLIFHPGDDPQTMPACLTFEFTLDDE